MTLTVQMRLDADADGFVGTMRVSNAELDKLNRAADAAGREAMDAARGVDRLGDSSRRMADDMTAGRTAAAQLRTALFGLIGVETLRRTIDLGDAWKSVRAQIEGLTRETGDFAAVFAGVRQISQETSTVLEDNVTLLRRLAIGGQEFGATNEELLQVTETVQQLGQIGQASTEALRAGTLQFSQAMSAGIVRAEEWNSVVENLPELAAALAQAMGMTVGEMRLAVVEGRVLSEDVFGALLDMSDDVQRRFDALPRGVRRASVELRNVLLARSGDVGAGGLNEAIVDLIDGLREAAEGSGDLARQLGDVLGLGINLAAGALDLLIGNIELVIGAGTAFVGVGLAQHLMRIATATAAATGAWARLNIVMSANPLGLVARGVAALGTGMLLLGDRTDIARRASERHQHALRLAREVMGEVTDAAEEAAEQQRQAAIAANQMALIRANEEIAARQAILVRQQQAIEEERRQESVSAGAQSRIASLREAMQPIRTELAQFVEVAQESSAALAGIYGVLPDQIAAEMAQREAAAAAAAAASRELAAEARALIQVADLELRTLRRLGTEGLGRLREDLALGAQMQEFYNEAIEDGHDHLTALDIAHRRYAVAVAEVDVRRQAEQTEAAAEAFRRLAEAITGAAAASRALGAVRLGTEQLRQEAEALRAGPDAVARLDRQRAGEAAFADAFDEAVSGGASQMAAIEAAMARRAAAMDLFDAQAAAGGAANDNVDAVERFVDGLQRQILALQLQREALVESEAAAIRWRGEVEEGNLARELGRALTEPETAAIRASIDALVDHTAALGRAREEAAARNAQVAEAQRLYDALREPVDAYRERLAELTGLMPDLVALTGDQAEAQDILGRAMAEAERDFRRAELAATGLSDVYGDLGRVGARALEDLRRGSFEAADALDALLAVAWRVAVTRPFEEGLTGLLTGIDWGSILGLGGVGAPTDIRPPAVRVPQAHGGGTVGELPATRFVDPRVFADAPRYHRGGLVGDELPVIAKRGEVIGWPEQMRQAFGGDVKIEIIDQRSSGAQPEVSETRGPDGRRMVRILLRDELTRGIADGDYDRVMAATYGLQRRGF